MGKETVVLDLGSAFVKCGFAGESAPRFILPSPLDGWLARAQAQAPTQTQTPAAEEDGQQPPRRRQGRCWGVAEWEEVLGPYIVRLYLHHLRCRPKDRKVVVCEPLAGPSALREALARVLFHWLKAPAVLVTPALTAALHTTGADGGLVVDVGYRECHVLAVAHGRPLLHTYQVAGVGARAMAERVQAALGRAGRTLDLDVAQEIVVRACFVRSREEEPPPSLHVTSLEYDQGVDRAGQTIDIPADLRGSAAEALFAEELDEDSLPAAVLRCLKKCPRDLRRGLASHVLVIGGGSMLPGFCARLAAEMRRRAASPQSRYQELAAALAGLCVVKDGCVLAPRNVLAWAGGSVLAVLEEAVSGGSVGGRAASSTITGSGLGRSRGGAAGAAASGSDAGSGGSRYLSRTDYLEAEARAAAQASPSLLPEWLAVGRGGTDESN